MAVSALAPEPVSFYATVFFLVNATYILLIRELVDRRTAHDARRRCAGSCASDRSRRCVFSEPRRSWR
jgi:hypothetical protein